MKNPQLGVDLQLTGTGAWTEQATQKDLATTARGDLTLVDDLENVRQALFMRLNTPKGDLWAHPDYGNAIFDIVGDPLNNDFLAQGVDAIKDCINAEPRVQLLDVHAEAAPADRIVIFTITYQVLDDTRIDNLVWTLDPERVRANV